MRIVSRLKEIIADRIETLNKNRIDDYANPSWAYQQADINGGTRELLKIIDLLSFDERK